MDRIMDGASVQLVCGWGGRAAAESAAACDRQMKCVTGPGLPSMSRRRTLTSVSPSGKFQDCATTMQNWTLDSFALRKEKSPDFVHRARRVRLDERLEAAAEIVQRVADLLRFGEARRVDGRNAADLRPARVADLGAAVAERAVDLDLEVRALRRIVRIVAEDAAADLEVADAGLALDDDHEARADQAVVDRHALRVLAARLACPDRRRARRRRT